MRRIHGEGALFDGQSPQEAEMQEEMRRNSAEEDDMRILYATDGSKGALAAAHLLASLPLDTADQLLVLTVAPEYEDAEGHAALAAAREALNHCPASLTLHTRRGDPAEAILRVAEDQAADLVVVGSRGLSTVARFFLGSVAERVARHALCPVLLVRPGHTQLNQVLVGVDGSDRSDQSIQWLRQFPLPGGCQVQIVTVLPSVEEVARANLLLPFGQSYRSAHSLAERQEHQIEKHLDTLADRLTDSGKQAAAEIRDGDPALELIQGAEENQADLVVVGSHGHSAVERFFMGSVSEKVLRHAPCSVMIVKQPVQRECSLAGLIPAAAASRTPG
jgi:nucleotide-binding universal stress UspA family protein